MALLAACPVLEAMSVDEFLHLDDGALEQVAAAAACGHDCLLISLSPLLSQLTADPIHQLVISATLHNLLVLHRLAIRRITVDCSCISSAADEQFKRYVPRHLRARMLLLRQPRELKCDCPSPRPVVPR